MKVVCCKNCGAKYQLDDDDDISAFECSSGKGKRRVPVPGNERVVNAFIRVRKAGNSVDLTKFIKLFFAAGEDLVRVALMPHIKDDGETTLTGAIKQWYTSSGIANLKKSDADTQTTEADTQQADDASQSGDQQTTDANAGQTADQQTTDANAGQTTDQQTTDTNAANQQTAEQPQAPAEYQVVTKDVVKVRDGASTDAKELGLLKEQVTLTAYGTEGDWTIVSYSAGTNGRAYIKTENLQTVGQ